MREGVRVTTVIVIHPLAELFHRRRESVEQSSSFLPCVFCGYVFGLSIMLDCLYPLATFLVDTVLFVALDNERCSKMKLGPKSKCTKSVPACYRRPLQTGLVTVPTIKLIVEADASRKYFSKGLNWN